MASSAMNWARVIMIKFLRAGVIGGCNLNCATGCVHILT